MDAGPYVRTVKWTEMQLEGIGAIITGGASGMGRAAAVRFAQAGARVAVLDIDAPGARETAGAVQGHAFACNIADPLSTRRAMTQAIAALGRLDVLITCAGIGRMEPIVSPAGEAGGWSRMLETIHVNLLGTLHLVCLAARTMVAQSRGAGGERGSIVMLGSAAAHEGPAASAAYCAAKGGVVSITLALARELGDHGIRVNTVSPGAVATPMLRNVPPQLLGEIARITPFPKRPGTAEEFAELAVHLVRNDYLNGAVIRLDGGHRLPYYSHLD